MRKQLAIAVTLLTLLTCVARSQDADGVYTKVDEKPTPTKTVKPVYPTELKRDGTEGMAAVSFVIDEKGDVISAEVKKSSHPGFEAPARDAILKWKFTPAKKDGKAVKVRVTIPMKFSLDE